MEKAKKTKENAKFAAACAFMLPGICAGLAVILAGAEGFRGVFPALLSFGVLSFSACVAWKL